MASIYNRNDSKGFWIACYPQPGKLVRASLQTDDSDRAGQIGKKIELLIALERLKDIPVPEKILAQLSGLPDRQAAASTASASRKHSSGDLKAAIGALITRSAATNAHGTLVNQLSQLRQFFGSRLVDQMDPRPPENRRFARRREPIEPWFKGNSLAGITPDTLLSFLLEKKFGLSSKRHYRELFHQLFRTALINGIYVPENPYVPNPAAELPSYRGTDKPITVLSEKEVAAQYDAVASNPTVLCGCQIMIEGGFRLHEALTIGRSHITPDLSSIRLILPKKVSRRETRLKTGERSVTVRPQLAEYLRARLTNLQSDWLIPSPLGQKWNSHGFADRLRELNRAAGLPWTSQDFRHTFATNRISEGWNLKPLADEMGTSIQMLMEHYAGYIAPPVLATLNAHSAEKVRPA